HRLFEIVRGAEDVALALAEIRLAVLREDVFDRHLLGGLHEIIEIEKRRADSATELPSDGRLAGAHEADEIDLHKCLVPSARWPVRLFPGTGHRARGTRLTIQTLP